MNQIFRFNYRSKTGKRRGRDRPGGYLSWSCCVSSFWLFFHPQRMLHGPAKQGRTDGRMEEWMSREIHLDVWRSRSTLYALREKREKNNKVCKLVFFPPCEKFMHWLLCDGFRQWWRSWEKKCEKCVEIQTHPKSRKRDREQRQIQTNRIVYQSRSTHRGTRKSI